MNFIVFIFIYICNEIISSKPFKPMTAKFYTEKISSKYLLEITTLVAWYTSCTFLHYACAPNTLSHISQTFRCSKVK